MNGGGRSLPVRELRRKNEKHFSGGEYKHGYFHQGQSWLFVIVGIVVIVFLGFVFVFDAVTLSPRSWLIGGKLLPRNNFRLEASTTAALTHFHTNLVCLFACPRGQTFTFCNSIPETVKYYVGYFVRKGGGTPN